MNFYLYQTNRHKQNKIILYTLIIIILIILFLANCTKKLSVKQYIDVAKVQINKGEYLKAYSNLIKAKSLAPNNAVIWYYLGIIQLRLGNIDRAINNEEIALQLDKTNPRIIVNLGYLYTISGYYNKAYILAKKLINSQNYKIYGYLILGNVKALKGQISKAKRFFIKAINKNPNNYEAYLDLANLYILTGEYDLAETCYQKAIELNPYSPYVYLAIAHFYIFLKKIDEAEHYFKKAISMSSNKNIRLRYEVALGDFYLKFKKFKKAFTLFQLLFDKYQYSKPEIVLKLAFSAINLKNFDLAQKLLDKLNTIIPNSYCVAYLQGLLYLCQGDYVDARYQFNKCQNIVADVNSLYILSILKLLTGYEKQSIAKLNQALQLNPVSAKVEWLLACLYTQNHQPILALTHLIHLIDSPKYAHLAHDLIAINLIISGQTITAGKELKLIKYAYPKDRLLPVLELALLLKKNKRDFLFKKIEKLWQKGTLPLPAVSICRFYPEIFKGLKSPLMSQDSYILYATAACLNAGDVKLADQLIDKASNQDSPSWLFLKASILIKEGKYQQSQILLTELIQKRPNYYIVYDLLGDTYLRNKKYKQAAQSYLQALKYNPDDINALNNRAWCLLHLSRPNALEDARALAEKALDLSPKDPKIMDTLGWIYYKLNMYSAGLQLVKRANRLNPNDITIKKHLLVILKDKKSLGTFN